MLKVMFFKALIFSLVTLLIGFLIFKTVTHKPGDISLHPDSSVLVTFLKDKDIHEFFSFPILLHRV